MQRLCHLKVLTLVLFLLCSGCLGTKNKREAVFYVGGNWMIPPSFNGNFWAPGGAGAHKSFVFEPLYQYVPLTKKFLPRLARSHFLAKDRMSLRVELRKGVLWHNGETFSSKDVKTTYLLGYIISWPIWEWLKLQQIELLDEHTLRFRWRQPITQRELIQILSYGEICYSKKEFGKWDEQIEKLIKEDISFWQGRGYGKTRDKDVTDHFHQISKKKKEIRDALYRVRPALPNGTGPFKLVTVTSDVQRLLKFEKGWAADKVDMNEVRVIRVPDNRMAWAVLISGELDASNAATPLDVTNRILQLNKKTKLGTPSDMQEFGFMFNTAKKPTSDLAFRQAIAHILDRKVITKVAYYYSDAIDDYSTGVLKSYRHEWLSEDFLRTLTKYDHSLEKASKLLLKAGYKKNDEGQWCYSDGNPINLEINTVPNSDWVMASEVASTQMSSFGIKTRVRADLPERAGTRMREGDFHIMAENGTDFRRYGLPEMSYRRYFSKGGVIATATKINEVIEKAEGDSPEKLVRKFDGHLNEQETKEIVEKLARFTNEYLPFLSVYEKRLMIFHTEGQRVQGWPDEEEPLWTAASSGIEGVFTTFMLQGRLKGVRR